MSTKAKRTTLKSIWPKLQKLLPLLASDKMGEVFNAAQKIIKLLKSVGMDLHDMVTLMFAAEESEESILDRLLKLLGTKDPDLLISIAQEKATFFRGRDGTVYATIDRETLPVEPKGDFEEWLLEQFLSGMKRATNTTAVRTAIRCLQALVRRHNRERHEVFIRNAEFSGRLYVDLANDRGEVVEIDADGFRIVDTCPVKFLRPAGMQPLPTPQHGGSIEQLRRFVNLSDAGFVLFVQLLIDALHRRNERPVGGIIGGEGRGKTSLAKCVQRLLDPQATDPGNPPPTVRELNVKAKVGFVLVFDNWSTLKRSLSDAVCRLSSGVGSSARKLFTNDQQVTVHGSRSIWFTAIKNPITEPDLAERTVILKARVVSEEARMTSSRLQSAFEHEVPFILGALYELVSHGLRQLPGVKLPRKPRLAEYFEGGVACQGIGFASAFDAAAREATDTVIEDDAVALAIVAFMADRDQWAGSASALMTELQTRGRTEQQVTKSWPHDVRVFGVRLWKMQGVLQKAGIELVEGERSTDRKRGRRLELRTIHYPAAGEAPPPNDPEDTGGTKVVALRRRD
jgi:hypothetical protein